MIQSRLNEVGIEVIYMQKVRLISDATAEMFKSLGIVKCIYFSIYVIRYLWMVHGFLGKEWQKRLVLESPLK